MKPIDISSKYNAMVAQQPVVAEVFAEALKDKKTAKALEDLLHFSKFSSAADTTRAGRLNARITLVLDVAARMESGEAIGDAVKALKTVDKQALAQRCATKALPNVPKDLRAEMLALEGFALAQSPSSFVAQFHRQLASYSTFACSDVVSFSGNINQALPPKKREEIRARPLQMTPERTAAEKKAEQAATALGGKLSQAQLKAVHEQMKHAHSGCCSTFAAAAAHILTGGVRDKTLPRVEVVSRQAGERGTHCYVIVGRAPNSDPKRPSTWGDGVVIVDTWLGSLGHPCTFTVDNYPYQGFLKPTSFLYDSHGKDDAPVVNAQAVLKRTAHGDALLRS